MRRLLLSATLILFTAHFAIAANTVSANFINHIISLIAQPIP